MSDIDKLKAALAEAGYPTARVFYDQFDGALSIDLSSPQWIPGPVCWAAFEVSGVEDNHCCWPCWDNDQGNECADGNCQNPDQNRWPPRELLIRG